MKDDEYFQKIGDSPERYALVKNGLHKGYSIVDIIDQLFVLIEDEDIHNIVQKKLQENGCKIFENICEAWKEKNNME